MGDAVGAFQHEDHLCEGVCVCVCLEIVCRAEIVRKCCGKQQPDSERPFRPQCEQERRTPHLISIRASQGGQGVHPRGVRGAAPVQLGHHLCVLCVVFGYT